MNLAASAAVKPSKSPLEVEGTDVERGEDDARRDDLKTFLDQCQAEFTYLMITPANPIPPRESPPLPILEDLREGEAFGVPMAQQQSLEQAFSQGGRPQQNH